MKLLIKDLSRMTSFSPARIRKWQERYRVFRPMQGGNGYWYYTNEDYLVLRSIQQRLALGHKLAQIMQLGREHLLANLIHDDYSEEDWSIIQAVKDGEYRKIERRLEAARASQKCRHWLKHAVQPVTVTVGRAWESSYVSITEEHAFSRWMHSYLMGVAMAYPGNGPAHDWLVATFPDDAHELGALMHFVHLRSRGRAARFAGMLPREELIREIRNGEYQRASISVVMPQTPEKLRSLRQEISKARPGLQVFFGGYGLSKRTGPQVAQRQPAARPAVRSAGASHD